MWWLKVGGLRAMRKRNAGLSCMSSRLLKFAQVSDVSEPRSVSPRGVREALSARQAQLLAGHDPPVMQVVEGLQLHHQRPAVSVGSNPSGYLPQRLPGVHSHGGQWP